MWWHCEGLHIACNKNSGLSRPFPALLPRPFPHFLGPVTLEILKMNGYLRNKLCNRYLAPSLATFSMLKNHKKKKKKGKVPKRSDMHRDYIKKVTPHCAEGHMWRTPFRYESTKDIQVLKVKLSFSTRPLWM